MFGAHASATPHTAHAPASAARRVNDEKGTVMLSLVERAIERLEEAVEQETAALQNRAGVDLKEFNDRKSQGLLELTRAMRHVEGTNPPDQAVIARLAGLRAKLEINSAALKMHLEAVREVSTALADVMRNAESDGTYSPTIRGGSRTL